MEPKKTVDYPILRNIPIEIDAAIQGLLGSEKVKGRGSPRPEQLRTLIVLHALGSDYASAAYDLWQSALKIARFMRGEDDIKSPDAVRSSLLLEVPEFDAALTAYQAGELPFSKLLNRLSSLVYYNTLSYTQDLDIRDFQVVLDYYSKKSGIPAQVAIRVAASKYLVRSATGVIYRDMEEQAMLTTYEQFLEIFKIAQQNT